MEQNNAKPLLESVFEELKDRKIIRTQAEFADRLGKNAGYISTLLKQEGVLPFKFMQALNAAYGISMAWLASEGNTGSMFVQEKGDNIDENKYNESDTTNDGSLLDLNEILTKRSILATLSAIGV
jgi:transcriptional regulator with XRE-family HTH domain